MKEAMHGNGWKRALFAREHIVEAVCTSNGNGRATEKASQRGAGRARTGRLCPGMGQTGTGWIVTGIWCRVSCTGYEMNGACGERGLRHVVW